MSSSSASPTAAPREAFIADGAYHPLPLHRAHEMAALMGRMSAGCRMVIVLERNHDAADADPRSTRGWRFAPDDVGFSAFECDISITAHPAAGDGQSFRAILSSELTYQYELSPGLLRFRSASSASSVMEVYFVPQSAANSGADPAAS